MNQQTIATVFVALAFLWVVAVWWSPPAKTTTTAPTTASTTAPTTASTTAPTAAPTAASTTAPAAVGDGGAFVERVVAGGPMTQKTRELTTDWNPLAKPMPPAVGNVRSDTMFKKVERARGINGYFSAMNKKN